MPSDDRPTVLVTGASGFVGLNVVERLLGIGHTVIAASHSEFPSEARTEFALLEGDLLEETVDIRNTNAIISVASAADVIIHGAAMTVGPERELAEGDQVIDVNIGGTRAILAAAQASTRVRRVVYVSSGAVHGEPTYGSETITEKAPPSPLGLYGLSKLTAELLVRNHAKLHDCVTVSARLSAVFGPWERQTGVRDSLSPMYQLALAAQQNRPIEVEEFAPRNWLYAREAATALVHLAIGPTPKHHLYTVSPTQWTSPKKWTDRLIAAYPDWAEVQATSSGETLDYDGDRTRKRAPVDNRRIRNEIENWPSRTTEEVFDDYLNWLEHHEGFR